MAKNNYGAGRKAEQKVASGLRRAGAFEHKKWLVQVKSKRPSTDGLSLDPAAECRAFRRRLRMRAQCVPSQ